jgi:hypothetical protein
MIFGRVAEWLSRMPGKHEGFVRGSASSNLVPSAIDRLI